MDKPTHTLQDPLAGMEPSDRKALLASEPSLWLGMIIQMNQEPRYRNSLNAIELMSNLNELRKHGAMAGSELRAS